MDVATIRLVEKNSDHSVVIIIERSQDLVERAPALDTSTRSSY